MPSRLHGCSHDVSWRRGVSLFADALRAQAVSVTEAAWQPPMAGTAGDLARVLADPRRDDANAEALRRMTAAGADLVDVRPAHEALGLERGTFLHAGPPIECARASGPMRGCAHRRHALRGPRRHRRRRPRPALSRATGSRSSRATTATPSARWPASSRPSMWVYELRDEVHDNTSWCSLNEGLGKVLRYGAYGPEVIDRLRWMNSVLGPILQQAVRARVEQQGPIDVKAIIAQMLQMGDEGHNRNRAGSLMLLRELLPTMITADASSADIAEAVRFSGANEHFFLNLGMPACKLRDPCRPRHPGIDRRHDDGAQRHRLRHPRVRHGRPVVHRSGQHPRGPLPRRPTAPTTPTPTSATRRSPRRPASAASPWPRRRRS